MSIQSNFKSIYGSGTEDLARLFAGKGNSNNSAQPERQRGLWNFLTWSFFLANFLTATEVYDGGAHAATGIGGSGDDAHSGGGDGASSRQSLAAMQHVLLEGLPIDGESA